MYRTGFAMLSTHIKCRGGIYPRSNVERFPVPDDKVSWSSEYKEYNPPEFTSPSIHGKPWADPNIGEFTYFLPAYTYIRRTFLSDKQA